MKSLSILSVLACVLLLSIPLPVASDPSRLPIFDAHVHYNEDATIGYSPAQIVERMIAAGVPRALVSSTVDDNTLALLEEGGPDLVVPFLRPYVGDIHRGNWFRHPEAMQYLRERWDTGRYTGVGEFHLHMDGAADSQTVRNVAAMAVAADKWLHVDGGADAIDTIFDHTPDVKILWAHAGLSEPPSVIARALASHDALWADISIRDYEIAPGGKIDPEWRDLFITYPDRFLAASDTYVTSRWDEYESILDNQRSWLAQLPPDVARKVAFENAVGLFGAGRNDMLTR